MGKIRRCQGYFSPLKSWNKCDTVMLHPFKLSTFFTSPLIQTSLKHVTSFEKKKAMTINSPNMCACFYLTSITNKGNYWLLTHFYRNILVLTALVVVLVVFIQLYCLFIYLFFSIFYCIIILHFICFSGILHS